MGFRTQGFRGYCRHAGQGLCGRHLSTARRAAYCLTAPEPYILCTNSNSNMSPPKHTRAGLS